MTDYKFGIDISTYQTIKDWAEVAKTASFVWIRASLGYGTDYKIAEHWKGSAGYMPRGIYHVVWNSTEAPAAGQLAHMLRMDKEYPCELRLALDVERADVGFSITEYLGKGYFDATGKYPVIYTSPGWWNNRWVSLSPRDREKYEEFFLKCDLWTAHYTNSDPMQVIPWNVTHIHQYSQSGTNAGVKGAVDLDKYLYAAEDFETHFGLSGTTPQPPPIISRKVRVRWNMPSDKLRFRSRPEFYPGFTLLLGKGDEMELLDNAKVPGDGIFWWKVMIDGYIGYVSAGNLWTELLVK